MFKRALGFTLVELMIVVAILLILARIALIKYSAAIEKARSAEAYAVLSDIAASESGYYTENNAYTSTWANLDRYDSAPVSNNFSFSSALSAVSSGYVQATATVGTVNYYMCISGGNRTAGSAPSCP